MVEREDVREVKKEGLPRSFQSLAMTGMLVSFARNEATKQTLSSFPPDKGDKGG